MAYVPLAVDKVAVRIGVDPEEAEGDMVSGNFFSGLGVSFTRGHGFTLEDETAHASIAVLSYSYWTTRFGRSPSAIGQTIYVKRVPFTVIGVTAQGFYGLEPASSTDFWIPLQDRPELTAWDNSPSLSPLYGTPKWWCAARTGRSGEGKGGVPRRPLGKLDSGLRAGFALWPAHVAQVSGIHGGDL